ncbi:endolytic transglycosylase MltG [Parasphingorhabdus halotolerans]|uniref:Endolytic murein transglycosylase n=1 Tax=Parasphingorhabdus halotolerans TaxID=2725558 RepID=A0A6H2DI86_9SPHN|nr:endolytic transglycosylase MltG [Parasphingorhabdus halotolerans]QJB68382.1 endolytic transglycosylase MltG [Parasphingorhabdus halotolerans]
MRRFGCLIIVVAAIICALLAGNFIYGWNASGPLENERTIVIKPGSSLGLAAEAMEAEGVIKSAETFLNRAKIFGGSEPIKAGEFQIPAGASNAQILEILQGGKAVQRLVTIPEGTPSIIVYEKLMAEKLLKGDIPVPAEGSVLPDSYAFERGEPRAAVLKRMQTAMDKTIEELWPKRKPGIVVKNRNELLTLASIVEKETALARERRTVAAVYSNRVKKNMMLQADPTIIYPITKGKPLGRRIRQSEIAAVNDYNTYAMIGLPKGPIANPGRSSIEAVLNPVETEYLFFVADGKGGHVFARTLQEHNANVEKWFAIRRQRGEM